MDILAMSEKELAELERTIETQRSALVSEAVYRRRLAAGDDIQAERAATRLLREALDAKTEAIAERRHDLAAAAAKKKWTGWLVTATARRERLIALAHLQQQHHALAAALARAWREIDTGRGALTIEGLTDDPELQAELHKIGEPPNLNRIDLRLEARQNFACVYSQSTIIDAAVDGTRWDNLAAALKCGGVENA